MKKSLIFGTIFICSMSLSGCLIKARDAVQDLPRTAKTVVRNTSKEGYPDLHKIPPVPTNQMSENDWVTHKSQLAQRRAALELATEARMATAQESDMSWATAAKSVLQDDPRAQPAINEDYAEWVARMRALLNFPEPQANTKTQ